jgi:2-polyprenyl-6-hydroxyphenyl methylase/3-demethylubiquinone-9 3-methyltransferase
MDRKGSGMLSDDSKAGASEGQNQTWDTGSHEDFYKYYEQQSLTPKTLERFRAVRDMMLRVGGKTLEGRVLDVLDVGCGAGAQSQFWAELKHRYRGIDVNEPLVQLARKRAQERGFDIRFDVGSATDLPCTDESVDICLVPELLEHVADWQGCLEEAVRVMRPGGLIYISTSSKLCPRQQEFNLPLYGWYPHRVKRHFEHRAVTDRPDLANYAKYPAVNWFSVYGLRDYLEPKGFQCLDRFDLIDVAGKGTLARLVLSALRSLPPLRLLAHMVTPYTLVVARKLGRVA